MTYFQLFVLIFNVFFGIYLPPASGFGFSSSAAAPQLKFQLVYETPDNLKKHAHRCVNQCGLIPEKSGTKEGSEQEKEDRKQEARGRRNALQPQHIPRGRQLVSGEAPWTVKLSIWITTQCPHKDRNGEWDVVVHHRKPKSCTGTIVSPRVIVTAAHCVFDEGCAPGIQTQANLEIEGNHILIEHPSSHEVKKATRIFSFVKDKDDTPSEELYNNDIAIIQVNTEYHFSTVIRPICLTNRNNAMRTGPARANGFGLTIDEKSGKLVSSRGKLRSETVLIEENMEPCTNAAQKASQSMYYFPINKLCANGETGGLSKGDSGGSLEVKHGGEQGVWFMHGCASQLIGSSDKTNPALKHNFWDVYTDVSHYCDRIQKTLDESGDPDLLHQVQCHDPETYRPLTNEDCPASFFE